MHMHGTLDERPVRFLRETTREGESMKQGQDFPSYLGPKKSPSGLAVALWGTLVAILFILVYGLIRGFVITKLWAWFVIPTFPSAPELTIPVAWGLSMLVSFLTAEHPDHNDTKTFWGNVLVTPFSVLFFGWLVSQWV